jgi:hypothetical protein
MVVFFALARFMTRLCCGPRGVALTVAEHLNASAETSQSHQMRWLNHYDTTCDWAHSDEGIGCTMTDGLWRTNLKGA